MAGALEKLKIYKIGEDKLNLKNLEDLALFVAYFNPASYSVSYGIEYESNETVKATMDQAKMKKMQARTFSFELILDGTGTAGPKIPVLASVKLFENTVYNYDGGIHSTPTVFLSWGSLIAKCVCENVSINYSLFNSHGLPLRAKIQTTFKEVATRKEAQAQKNDNSADITHQRVVRAGETLPLLCEEIYGDPRLYVKVAEVNGLINFRKIKPGMTISFPPLKKG